MLFVFETHRPQKYLLHITTESKYKSILDHQISLTCLQRVLSESIEFPIGNLKQICKVEDIVILMWNFEEFTPCSGASVNDFDVVNFSKRLFDLKSASLKGRADLNGKGAISLPYFTLGYKQIDYFYDEEDGSYMFPDTSENVRLEALPISLHANQYNVKGWDGTKTVEHYCQFSGGGDIYIAKDNLSPVLVFVVPKDSSATDEDDESPEGSLQSF